MDQYPDTPPRDDPDMLRDAAWQLREDRKPWAVTPTEAEAKEARARARECGRDARLGMDAPISGAAS